ncbi:glutamate-5-semialdehyde dehydrogenase [Legionella maioricensis]|uniref:Gamma-glutamyl phosphate reductase n=1 Tax=Legionella maioricensis TaxID=2896528 RepID=A0A9X2D1F7_9GAMM|nr:glutamate-5-semialdehyde dehydrogenase [Legionella maioricensis]MCL9684345.1 glutamate-5-semialdehyde dehydrogenase [Legionella maioricensis]MCL9688773.1 glutamate-5-semialdehyde dehydrogenase [Legionella maioricensis]
MDTLIEQLKAAKETSYRLKLLTKTKRKEVLLSLAAHLRKASHKIIAENQKDLLLMAKDDPRYDRLLLSEERISAIADDVELVASLPDPLGTILEEQLRPNGLRIQKISVPLGVVAVIYESRPNVTIDVFSLCFKTGNACVLKGGKEAYHSNKYLVSLIHQSLQEHHLSKSAVYLLPPEREATHQLLNATKLIDVCIPRGSQSLIQFVREHAKIPVIETGAGIVHIYFDSSGDIEKGRLIINNAKTRRVSVCNALDTLVIDEKSLTHLCFLVELLASKNVEIYADDLSYKALRAAYPESLLHQASPDDFGHEFLSYKMAIKTVSSVEDAVKHIMEYTSGHSEAIIAEDPLAVTYFLDHVDAAAVYVNASTAFTDGGQFGMGAEIGISTQKLHARGPMGLAALTSYKWLIFGDGQIRA